MFILVYRKINKIVKILKDMDVDGISEVFRRNDFDSQIQISHSDNRESCQDNRYRESVTVFKPFSPMETQNLSSKPEVLIDLRDKLVRNFIHYIITNCLEIHTSY